MLENGGGVQAVRYGRNDSSSCLRRRPADSLVPVPAQGKISGWNLSPSHAVCLKVTLSTDRNGGGKSTVSR